MDWKIPLLYCRLADTNGGHASNRIKLIKTNTSRQEVKMMHLQRDSA